VAYVFLALTIVLIAAGQIAQKFAARDLNFGSGFVAGVRSLFLSPAFWVAVVLMGLGLLVWLVTLSVLEVSKAYPILSLSFVITALLARITVNEHITRPRWMAIGLISAGAAIMLVVS
jgi:undecaprenyl phosphate-alpha-L-ara4N flippase subunit ArnE